VERRATEQGTDLEAQVSLLRRQLERERRARATAEREGERATAALYETVQQLREAEEELRLRAQDQQLLHELARDLRRDLEPSLVLRRAAAAVGRATQVERCVIRLADGDGIGPIVEQWTAPGIPRLREDFELQTCLDSLALEAARAFTVLAVDDVRQDKRVDPADAESICNDLGALSYAGCPMWAGQELVGWVALHAVTEPRPWTDHQLSLAEALGRDVAVALLQSQAYRRQKEAVIRLKEVDRVKSDFVSTVSHELRTPLTNIAGYVELLSDTEQANPTPGQLHMLQIVSRNTERLCRLVEDLLTLSSSDLGVHTSDPVRLDVREVLTGVRSALAPLLHGRDLTLDLDVPPDLPPVAGQPDVVARVLEHLLSNAVKFTPDGGRVSLAVTVDGDALVVTVADNGHGIAADDLPHVFDRFYRAAKAQDLAIQGTGLGLAVTRALVETVGGTVDLESAAGRGTTATVRLPGVAAHGQQ
jgi:signal transduction histidine kinase